MVCFPCNLNHEWSTVEFKGLFALKLHQIVCKKNTRHKGCVAQERQLQTSSSYCTQDTLLLGSIKRMSITQDALKTGVLSADINVKFMVHTLKTGRDVQWSKCDFALPYCYWACDIMVHSHSMFLMSSGYHRFAFVACECPFTLHNLILHELVVLFFFVVVVVLHTDGKIIRLDFWWSTKIKFNLPW